VANIAPWQGDLSIGIGSAACARGVSASSQGKVTIRALTSQRSIIARAFASRNAASGEPRIALDQRLLDADETHDRKQTGLLVLGRADAGSALESSDYSFRSRRAAA
jgi:hypothetical protein